MEVPEDLTEEGAEVYKSVVSGTQRLGIYDPTDNHLIKQLAKAIVKERQTWQELQEDGWSIRDEGHKTKRKHPVASANSKARRTISKMTNKLGLNPNSRSQISIPDTEEEEESDLQEIINR